jgi:benzoate membrane transport protein
LRPVAAGLSLAAVFLAVIAIPLEAASGLNLTAAETSAWIMMIYGLPSLLTIVLIIRYRQPLLITGNVFVLIFVLLLGGELTWPELVGATMVAGGVVLILALTGFTDRLAAFLPPPIVYGLLAGAVLGLLAEMFTALGTSTLLVGVTVGSYLLSRFFFGERVPALLTALVVGVSLAVIGQFTGPAPTPVWPAVNLTMPVLSIAALLTAAPVLVVFITLQANAPAVVYLRSQGYEPPEHVISLVSGSGTMVASIMGPMGVSLSLPSTALTAGPHAGGLEIRHWGGYLAASAGLLIAAVSGFIAELLEFIPPPLLTAIVGLAVIGILSQALQEMTKGPLLLGPLVALATSVSNLELLGLGRFFWALVLGIAVSLLAEKEGWKRLREAQDGTTVEA